MKIKFTRECQDKYNGTFYKANSIYEFENERAEEILKTGYAEAMLEEPKPRKKKASSTNQKD